jgi:hypothetical protein
MSDCNHIAAAAQDVGTVDPLVIPFKLLRQAQDVRTVDSFSISHPIFDAAEAVGPCTRLSEVQTMFWWRRGAGCGDGGRSPEQHGAGQQQRDGAGAGERAHLREHGLGFNLRTKFLTWQKMGFLGTELWKSQINCGKLWGRHRMWEPWTRA